VGVGAAGAAAAALSAGVRVCGSLLLATLYADAPLGGAQTKCRE